MEPRRIIAAMSGGVDSSVAAAVLVEEGVEVVGVTLRLLPRLQTGLGCCGSPADVDDARTVCGKLKIPHYVLDMASLFERSVVTPFVEDYLRSRTPNPCVECNRSVKFGYLSRLAAAWGADAVATGHYARIKNGRLFEAADPAKDQSYFLYSIPPAELTRVVFPIGELTKPEVRGRARRLGLSTAEKPESQEICFVGGRDYRAFVAARAGGAADKPGEITDRRGRVLGRHGGLAGFTIGQRRGLGDLARPGGAEAPPLYVVGMDPRTNTLVVGSDEETLAGGLVAEGVCWLRGAPAGRIEARVRVRHRHRAAAARVIPVDGALARVAFLEPQRAVAPGQAAVFYADDGEVLGGGTIQEALA